MPSKKKSNKKAKRAAAPAMAPSSASSKGSPEMVSTMMDFPLVLSTLMDRGVRMQPDNKIITMVEGGYHVVTYSEHQHDVHRLAAALEKFGVSHGEVVGTLMWNNSRHLACYHAVPSMGYVLHPINLKVTQEQMEFIIQDAGDRVIVVDEVMLPTLEKCSEAALSKVDLFVVVGTDFKSCKKFTTTLPAKKLVDWDEFLRSAEDKANDWSWPVFPETSASAMCYTSGTTGNPKGVVYSHRSTYLHTQVLCQKDCLELSGADTMLLCPAMFHANSWGMPYATCMLGMKLVLPSRFGGEDTNRLLQGMIDHHVTVACGVPSIWQSLRPRLQKDMVLYTRTLGLKRLVCGGAPVSEDMMTWYALNFGVEFIQQWGMTETSPLGTCARQVSKKKHLHQAVTEQLKNVVPAGLPLPGLEFSVRDSDDLNKPLAEDGHMTGELLIRGPWVTGSYYNASDLSKKFHVDENGKKWLITGDMASIDSEGNMILRDRQTDLIKSGGEWISSVALENHICSVEGVLQACVVAQQHPVLQERPVAIVVGSGSDAADLKRNVFSSLKANFPAYQVPDDVLVWSSIPLTAVGKLDKKGVRAMLKQKRYVLPALAHSSVAIVGVGPRGLNVLARLCERARNDPAPLHVYAIEPKQCGPGSHPIDQPDHLIINTTCCQITMFEDDTIIADEDKRFSGPTLYEWAKQEGHLYHNPNAPNGSEEPREVRMGDCVPRALLGKYLQWTYRQVLARLPGHVRVEHIRNKVVDMSHSSEEVSLTLDDGSFIHADYVFMTSGHGTNVSSQRNERMGAFAREFSHKNANLQWIPDPYPIVQVDKISPNASVAIQGLGLTATDIVSHLTIGRGGKFTYKEVDGNKVATYHKSGKEPTIYPFARKGGPFACRGVNQKGVVGKYQAHWMTIEGIDAMRNEQYEKTGCSQLEWETHVFPVLKKDMAYSYHLSMCKKSGAKPTSPADFDPPAEVMNIINGLFSTTDRHFVDLEDYQSCFSHELDSDIKDAWAGNVDGPIKAATDVVRDVRGTVRYAIDYAGLTPKSHFDFLSNYGSIINRVCVGPPMERNLQLRALIDAGIVKIECGPAPSLETDEENGKFTITSRFTRGIKKISVDAVVLAKLDKFYLEQDRSPLMRAMCLKGTLRPFHNRIGGIDVTTDQNPISLSGGTLDRVWALGNLCEGVNYYTYILPRPFVGSRALLDAAKVVDNMHEHRSPSLKDKSLGADVNFKVLSTVIAAAHKWRKHAHMHRRATQKSTNIVYLSSTPRAGDQRSGRMQQNLERLQRRHARQNTVTIDIMELSEIQEEGLLSNHTWS